MDIQGPDGSLGVQNRFAVVVIDYFSKCAEVEFKQEATAPGFVNMFRRLFHREGIPRSIRSDNGVQFCSEEFGNMVEEFELDHQKSLVYHSMGNALVE